MAEKTYKEWIDGFQNNFTYYNPAPQNESGKVQLPIIANGVVYNNGEKSVPKEVLEEAHLCGFNVCIQQSISQLQSIYDSLKWAVESKVTLMFSTSWFYPNLMKNGIGVDKTINYPFDQNNIPKYPEGFGGVFLLDEPTYYEMIGKPDEGNDDSDEYTSLQNKYRNLMEQQAQCIVYINLVGGPVSKFMPSGSDANGISSPDQLYRKYLQTFQDYYKPSFFCYDYYPITEVSALIYQEVITPEGRPIIIAPEEEGEIYVNNERFHNMLELYSAVSKLYKRPFWTFCESKNFMNTTSNYLLPFALEQYLKFEAFASLAYGAQGINYWGYAVSRNKPGETYITALVNRKRGKTASWYYAQKVNSEIQKYSYIFMDDKNAHTYIRKSRFLYIYASKKLEISSEDNEDLYFGEWSNIESTYIMVVNTSPLIYRNININIENLDVKELTPIKSGGPENVFLNKGLTTRILPPGGYRIFQFLNKGPVQPPVGPIG